MVLPPRHHLYFSAPAPSPGLPGPSSPASWALHGKARTSPAPRHPFILRLKINLRLLLMSIAQRQRNNSCTCSLFVSPAPHGELLMDRGFQRPCLTGTCCPCRQGKARSPSEASCIPAIAWQTCAASADRPKSQPSCCQEAPSLPCPKSETAAQRLP